MTSVVSKNLLNHYILKNTGMLKILACAQIVGTDHNTMMLDIKGHSSP